MITNTDEIINIGQKSTQCLNNIGIVTRSDLEKVGAIPAFVKITQECSDLKPSLNLLYGLVAYLENSHWTEVARHEKGRLLIELEGYREMDAFLKIQ